jgi:hypothetical protein
MVSGRPIREQSETAVKPGRCPARSSPRPASSPWCPFARASSAPRTPETLAARGDLATWTGRAGDPAAARDQLTDLLPVGERVLGPEHPETLTISNNLAYWTGRAGDPAAAPSGPVRGALTHLRASPRPGASGRPDGPRQRRPLDRRGGCPSRRPRDVYRVVAHPRMCLRPRAPVRPDHARQHRPDHRRHDEADQPRQHNRYAAVHGPGTAGRQERRCCHRHVGSRRHLVYRRRGNPAVRRPDPSRRDCGHPHPGPYCARACRAAAESARRAACEGSLSAARRGDCRTRTGPPGP